LYILQYNEGTEEYADLF